MQSPNPLPIIFNPLKHHLGFIRSYIRETRKEDNETMESDLKKIGESQMDLYVGELNISEIEQEVLGYLSTNGILEKGAYANFINNNYQQIQLSDQSKWILRMGEDSEQYVHIHPARNGPHVVRVKASTMKTVIAVQVLLGDSQIGIDEVNWVREECLGLSRLKMVRCGELPEGVGRVLELVLGH